MLDGCQEGWTYGFQDMEARAHVQQQCDSDSALGYFFLLLIPANKASFQNPIRAIQARAVVQPRRARELHVLQRLGMVLSYAYQRRGATKLLSSLF